MKKTLLTTAMSAVLLAGYANAGTPGHSTSTESSNYFKFGLGYSVANQTNQILEGVDSTKRLHGIAPELAFGTHFSPTMSVEGFLDYVPSNAKTEKTPGTSIAAAAANKVQTPLDNKFFAGISTKENFYSGATSGNIENATDKTRAAITIKDSTLKLKENRVGLGLRAKASHNLGDNFILSAGLGGGVVMKDIRADITENLDNDSTLYPVTRELKTKNVFQPFGEVSLGADLAVSDSVSMGLAYRFRFSTDRDIQLKDDLKQTLLSYDTSGLVTATGDTAALAKDAVIGHATKIHQAVTLTTSFKF